MAEPSSKATSDSVPPHGSRGERSWRQASEALFLLNRQRRVVFVNRAWESVTGLSFAEVRGHVCRRRADLDSATRLEQILAALAPPSEARQGRPCQTRRRAPGKKIEWWDLDFFPWSDEAGVLATLGKIRVCSEVGATHAALPEKLVQIQTRQRQLYALAPWSDDAPALRRLLDQVRLAAQTTAPVLLLGPPGAGKEWTARTVHQLSDRRDLNFASLDDRLPAAVFAEVFASAPAARLGVIYLRNVERLPRDVQELVLRRLDDDGAAVRIMAASSADLDAAAAAGRLLPLLYARLAVLCIRVPSLAERGADFPHHVRAVLERLRTGAGLPSSAIAPAALELLRRHDWPGNFIELLDVLTAAGRAAKSECIGVDDLPYYLRPGPPVVERKLALDDTLAKVERRLLELAMKLAQGNKTRAAELLGIWRPRLIRRLEQLHVPDSD
ncbi:MAG: sigma 54-interacting transcriptional regulator [Gemmataceae bacterium]|nr:sigma 54-interacting transcriptional regulator [Gemmataceae bacterium]